MAVDKKDIDHNSFKERSITDALGNDIDDADEDYSNDMPYSNLDDDDFEEFSNIDPSSNGLGEKDDEGSKPDQNAINYMRRKRQTSTNLINDNEIDRLKSLNKKSDEKPQKKQFNELKKFFRKSKKGKKVKRLPWTCHFETKWIKLDKDYYPPYIQSGSCQTQKKCFYDLYECKPKKYGVQILKRDPTRCNPIPALGNSTIYEEVWIKEQIDIKVACECGIAKRRRRKNKGRP